jgi:hypothetical protein
MPPGHFSWLSFIWILVFQPMFLMFSMLGGLGAIAIPVIVHLLHRQKTTPIQWGAMQFLIESPLQQKRWRHIEHWLLLLARMAVVGLLAVVLARPLLNADLAMPLGGGTSTDFAVVIDHSLSTGRAAGGGKTVFGRSVELASQIAGSLKATDTLSIVLAEHTPRALSDRPLAAGSSDLSKARETLGQMKPGVTDAHLADAVRAAREVVNHGRGVHKKILVLGDEQKSGWQIDDATAWKLALGDGAGGIDRNVAVFSVPISPDAAMGNVSVGGLEIRPAVISPNRPVEIIASLSQSGSTALPAVPVGLWVDGSRVASQTVTDLSSGGSRTVRFEHVFTTAGSHRIKVQAEIADALEADNAATLAVNVLEKLPVLVIDGQLTGAGSFRGSQFLRAAMQPEDEAREASSLVRAKVISLSDAPRASFADYAAVLVNDVPGLPADVLSRLADHARGGHGVWFILGPRTQPRFVNEALGKAGLLNVELGAAVVKIEKDVPGIIVKDLSSPMVSLLSSAEKNVLTGVVATQWWPLKTTPPDARIVLATTTGESLVLDRPMGSAGGHVVLWTTSADARWNTLPLASSFVPLVQETLLHLAGPAIGATYGRNIDAGKPIVWRGAASPAVLSGTITRMEDGVSAPLKVSSESGRPVARYADTHVPGLYEMRFMPSDLPQPVYFSVGIDPRELDPATLSSSDLSWLKDNGFVQARLSPEKLSAVLAAPGSGSELWPTLAFAVVGLLVLETFMTYRMIRLQASAARIA